MCRGRMLQTSSKRVGFLKLCILSVGVIIALSGELQAASPIADNWVHATVQIVNEWGESGSGFFVCTIDDKDNKRFFLVTSKHVVHEDPEKRKAARFLMLKVNVKQEDGTISGASVPMPLKIDGHILWREHPLAYVDVMAIEVTLLMDSGIPIENYCVGPFIFATPDILKKEEITIGEEVLIIGYPLGFTHTQIYSPLVRQGIIASRIGERIHTTLTLPGAEDTSVEIPGFLVDSAIVPGSSGSPVVLKPVFGRLVGGKVMNDAPPPYLLGIVASSNIAPIKVGDRTFPAFANLGVVFDVTTIMETIDLFFVSPQPSTPTP
jgi:hypothetical protein